MNNEFEQLSTEDQDFVMSAIHATKMMVWHFYTKSDGLELKDFRYDETCVKYIEDYLASRIRTRILKWTHVDGTIIITRVKTQSGLASSDEEQIQKVLGLIQACSILFGQCIVEIFDGKWRIDAERTMYIDMPDTGVQIYWKCLKYVTLGDEDSLTSFVKSIRNHKTNHALVEMILNNLNLKKQDYDLIQEWVDLNGKLEKIVVLGKDREIIETIIVGTM